jgi:hypothetical protein
MGRASTHARLLPRTALGPAVLRRAKCQMRERTPEMTATFTAEKRRPSPTRPLRGLPVLFHLMDVSRPKGYAAPPSFTLGSVADPPELYESPLASRLPSEPPIEAPDSFDLETAAELVQTKAYGSLPADMTTSVLAPTASDTIANSSEASLDQAVGDQTPAPSLETPPPASDDAVTLRQRAEERQRKRQEGKKDDWFGTQGKYIAIGFVAALMVTIYVARSSRQPAKPHIATKPHAHSSAAATTKGEASPLKPAVASESAKITSVHPTTKATASEPKTALHPPTVPQVAQQPEKTSATGDATLFSFTRRTEERVAANTDAPTTASPVPTVARTPQPAPTPAQTTPAQTTPAQTTPAQTTPSQATPTLQPQYPSTKYPSSYQPVAPPPAYAPLPASPGGPNLGPAASTMPLYPTTNTASGTRYERTGSGLY